MGLTRFEALTPLEPCLIGHGSGNPIDLELGCVLSTIRHGSIVLPNPHYWAHLFGKPKRT